MNQIQNMLSALNEDEKRHFIPFSYPSKSLLHASNDLCTTVSFLLHGSLVMENIDENGKEEIFNVLKAPAIYGNNLLFSSSPYYLSDVIALSSVEGYQVKKDDLLEILKKNERFFSLYMSLIADKTIALTRKLKIISIQNAKQRVQAFLESKFKEQHGFYSLSSVTELAKELSLPRETVSRALSSLEREGYLTRTNKILRRKKNALESF